MKHSESTPDPEFLDVSERAFCNRQQELHDLRRAAENGDHLLIYAERRMGKTPLIQRVLERL